MKGLKDIIEFKRKHPEAFVAVELMILSAMVYGIIKSGYHMVAIRSWLDV